jgi:predicted N-acetyltransferase YhbS
MTGVNLEITDLTDTNADLETCAGWLHAQWGHDMGYSLANTTAWLTKIVQPGGTEAALIARQGGLPVGICLLVDCDLEGRDDLTPWLSSLYVLPEYRRQSIGSRLVDGIETLARQSDAEVFFLYTKTEEPYYARRNWITMERFRLESGEFALMQKSLF